MKKEMFVSQFSKLIMTKKKRVWRQISKLFLFNFDLFTVSLLFLWQNTHKISVKSHKSHVSNTKVLMKLHGNTTYRILLSDFDDDVTHISDENFAFGFISK